MKLGELALGCFLAACLAFLLIASILMHDFSWPLGAVCAAATVIGFLILFGRVRRRAKDTEQRLNKLLGRPLDDHDLACSMLIPSPMNVTPPIGNGPRGGPGTPKPGNHANTGQLIIDAKGPIADLKPWSRPRNIGPNDLPNLDTRFFNAQKQNLAPGKYTLEIDYPLTTAYRKEIIVSESGLSYAALAIIVSDSYREIYSKEMEWEAAGANGEPPFGTWGHILSDLCLEGIEVDAQNMIRPEIGS